MRRKRNELSHTVTPEASGNFDVSGSLVPKWTTLYINHINLSIKCSVADMQVISHEQGALCPEACVVTEQNFLFHSNLSLRMRMRRSLAFGLRRCLLCIRDIAMIAFQTIAGRPSRENQFSGRLKSIRSKVFKVQSVHYTLAR